MMAQALEISNMAKLAFTRIVLEEGNTDIVEPETSGTLNMTKNLLGGMEWNVQGINTT